MHFPDTLAIVLAAGASLRFGRDKLLLSLQGMPVIAHTLSHFISACENVLVVLPRHLSDRLDESLPKAPNLHRTVGGATRHESLKNALLYWQAHGKAHKYVLIHDGARPNIQEPLVSRVMEKLKTIDSGAVLPVLPSHDTVYQKTGDSFKILPRNTILHAQTPQGFYLHELIERVQSNDYSDYTDEASLYLEQQCPIFTVDGEYDNLKITSQEDENRLQQMMKSHACSKTGFGFDVHRMIAGNPMVLGGYQFDCGHQLVGHSDADVVLHALSDAIYGMMAMEDIGYHFPPSEERWKNADSNIFLQHALQCLTNKKGVLQHVDITIVAEYPKITPHRGYIKESLASRCGLDISQASVKATTTEGLGFTGRGEGIAVYAQTTATFYP